MVYAFSLEYDQDHSGEVNSETVAVSSIIELNPVKSFCNADECIKEGMLNTDLVLNVSNMKKDFVKDLIPNKC